MAANERLLSLLVRHHVHLTRYGNSVEREIIALLNSVDEDLIERLGARLANINERGMDLGPRTTKRLTLMLNEIRALNDGVFERIDSTLVSELRDFAINEGEFQAKSLSSAIGTDIEARIPSPQRLKSIATERPMDGQFLKPFIKNMGANRQMRIEQAVRVGMVEGQGIEAIVSRIKGTKAAGYTDGILDISRRSARAMVRTSINHVANHAAQETWAENIALVQGWRFVGTLDSRTSVTCASNDGKVFEIGKGPIPPLHPNCRSISIAYLPDQDLSNGKRASADGQVPADMTFDKWLKTQDEAVQNEVLGAGRGELWRAGKLNLSQFIRDNREIIPLAELRKLHPEAFTGVKAGKAASAAPVAVERTQSAPERLLPRNPEVTDESIEVQPRLTLQKALRSKIAAAHKAHPWQQSEFKGGTKAMGKVNFSAEFDDETVSMIAAILPEIDTITDAFKVPPLRGITSAVGKASASMGDSVMTINPRIFNGYAAKVGKRAKTAPDIDKTRAELDTIRAEYKTATAAANKAIDAGDYAEYKRLQAEVRTIGKRFDRVRNKFNRSAKNDALVRAISQRPASTWKLGDPIEKRPHGAQEYFTGIDKARTVMYHEIAHLVHQERFRTGYRREVGIPPIETKLNELFRELNSKDSKAFYNALPSDYAKTNSKEWFAENFALYLMNKREMVHPELVKLIEELLND